MLKKTICLLLTMAMIISMLPTFHLPAAAATTDLGQMNALDALGIDTSVMPEGYDPNSLDNPYGRDNVEITPVYEMFMTRFNETNSKQELSLYGHNKPLNQSMSDFYNKQCETVSTATYVSALPATASASGNFIGAGVSGDALGKTGQIVTVGVGAMSEYGGLYLYFTDPDTGTVSNEPKTLIPTTKIIGNTGKEMDEDFIDSPILMQNYLQITTGDFKGGDGIDEVAVYVAEQDNSRVEIYQLQTTNTSGDEFFLDPGNWAKVWTHYFNENPYVSNMVSLTAGDLNRDGTDDLALTWGYYYGPNENSGSQAVVLYGDNTNMFQQKRTIDLNYGTAPIVRAAFAYGDIDGDNVEDLILGGQLHTDIMAGNLNSRFVAVYTYDGYTDYFITVTARNFDLFEKKDGQYVHAAMAGHGNKFYSSPASVANITPVKMNGIGFATYIYLDSLLFEFGDSGLEIIQALDQNPLFNKNINTPQKYYVEYNVIAANFTGGSSGGYKENLQVMQYYPPVTVTYTYKPYHWWWWWWIEETTVTKDYPAELNVLGLYKTDTGFNIWRLGNQAFSTSFCKLNTDNDTSLLEYTKIHYVKYSDPKVLAVLASPPYFADLDNDELSGSYMESQTSYRSSTGTGTAEVTSHTIRAGRYVSFQKDFEVPVTGQKLGSFETELSYTANLTWETTRSSQMEQSITYSTVAGSDSVAFYSIPMETYVYKSFVPIINKDTGMVEGYDEQLMSINIPHTAAVRVLPLATYERIAADYSELPQISGNILTHTVGVPSTYPSSTAGFNKAIVYNADPAGVDYGGGSITQEITMTNEAEDNFTHSHAVDFKIGSGPGDVVFGTNVGYEYGSSRVTVTTSGSTFTGQVNNMPVEAEPYRYNYSWRVFSYEYSEGGWALGSGLLPEFQGTRFPVVSYLVTGVSAPPKLPSDFQQDMAKTTDDSITLKWSYSGPAAGFQIYRYYEFPDGSGSYELGFVKASEQVTIDPSSGTRYYEYTDAGLHPYTDYAYQIQVIGASQPTHSIPSQVYRFRTKTDVGYPSLSLTGVSNGMLPTIYPDTEHTVSVIVNNIGDYSQPPKYQWQKLTENGWQDILGATNPDYTFKFVGLADEGQYRCRVNVIYGQYYISDYSEVFSLPYSKRTPDIRSFTVADADVSSSNVPKIEIFLGSAHENHNYPPSGVVVFDVVGADYRQSFSVALGTDSESVSIPPDESYASITLDHPLPDGAYEITAFYSGSRVYKSLMTSEPIPYLAGTGSGYVLTLDSSYVYGNSMEPSVKSVVKQDGITIPTEIIGDTSYQVVQYSFGEDGRQYATTIEGFVYGNSVTAFQAGDFSIIASVSGEEVASKSFSVTPKEVTIGITSQQRVAYKDILHPDSSILTVDYDTPLAYQDTIADLGLTVRATNTAGTVVTLSNDTNPGIYDIIGIPGEMSSGNITYSNYSITYKSGTYILTGPTFKVTGSAIPLNNKIVGTIELLTPEGNEDWSTEYSNGTDLQFLAQPNVGYDIKSWTITDSVYNTIITTGGSESTFHYTMLAQSIDVSVDFEVAQRHLEYLATGQGTVVCTSNTVLQSGDVAMEGAEFTFKATPAEGYHFKQWQLIEMGKTPSYPIGIANPDGSNTCTITMGADDTTLYAVFVRDSYQLTLQGDLQAGYWANVDTWRTAVSGDWIKGDTYVEITPKPGFSVKSDGTWTMDGQPISTGVSEDNQKYTFTMVADTVIAAETEVGHFDINLQIEGAGITQNAVLVTVNGMPVNADNLSAIAGGSTLTFTAMPAYGYVFDKWIVNDEIINDTTHNIAALGGNLNVRAVFKANTAYTISVIHGERGSVTYTLNGGESKTIASGGVIPVFAGDQVVITATPQVNFMVEHWWINGALAQTTVKTQTFNDIAADLNVEVVFGAQTYSSVVYVAGTNGAIVSATSDGVSFESGSNSVGNGTRLEFTAVPDDGFMVDEWLLNEEVVKNHYGQPLVDPTFCIAALSGDSRVKVTFREIITHIVQVEDTNTTTTVEFVPASAFVADEVYSKVYYGATAIFTVTPNSGYRITSAGVTGNTGAAGLSGFDSITKQADGTWIGVVGAVTADLAVTTEAKQLYSITVPTIPVGGSITVSADKALEGEEITLTAIPASGYSFSGWTVTGGNVTLSDASTTPATFTMPNCDVTVAAAFTYINYGGGGDGGGGSNLPDYVGLADGTILVTLTATKRSISDSVSQKLIELNKISQIVISGNGVKIIIPIGTLQVGDDVNDIIPDLSTVTGGPGQVVAYTDATGKRHVVAWSVVGQNEVFFTAKGSGKYEIVDNSKEFEDIDGHWGANAITFVTARELFKGTSDSKFSADADMTRAMLVTVLHRLDGLALGEGENFSDVTDGQWYSDAVAWAAANNIVGGYGDGNFGTSDNITREQLVTILYRYAGFIGAAADTTGNLAGFNDVDYVSDYAREAMNWAVEAGLISGRPGGLLDPTGNASRAEVAAVLKRLIDLLV